MKAGKLANRPWLSCRVIENNPHGPAMSRSVILVFSYVNLRYTWRLDKPTVFLIKDIEMWNQGQGHLHLGD